ncbi:uncharacterized protein [Lolium perenne]|uniref:uncharacterized protein n=1 Tax=Lolium perenne TaxID=4522 RepID=UPI0021F69400|nr:uncharacterized protein LOC127336586 [Lolium perenne]
MESPRAGVHGEGGHSPSPSPSPGAARMLHEMALREGGNLDLTDEQLRSNDQLQQDEMLALEAIYGENVEVFGETSAPRSFQIHVHCEIPDGISVSAELLQGVDDYPNNWLTFSVEHLAPMSLTCLMPPSYPSHQPPYFNLGIQWLDRAKVSSLCHMLDTIWAQQPGQEVVFEWVQWLQSSMLSHLGFDGRIIIRQSDRMMGHVDVRAVGDILSVEEIVEHLISYNEEQCHETFLRGIHVCTICLHEYTGIDFIKLPCRHYFCRRCMETYSKMHVKEGSVLKLVCPDDKCGGIVPPNLLKRLLGDAYFERWERLILQKTLDSMTDLSYCPRCETPCLEDDDTAQCSNCHFSFCTHCRDRRHIGTRCFTQEEKLLSLQGRGNVPNLSKGNAGRKISADEIFSIKEILRSCVACPHCGFAISRASGCNHILCRNCDKSFCYSCGKALNEDHTSEQCKIDREKLRVNVEVNDVVKKMQKDLRLTLSRAHPCSNCHQPNFKVGNNNHIFCGTCQVHYCALCQKRVYKSTEHYGPRGCKQHTSDLDFV